MLSENKHGYVVTLQEPIHDDLKALLLKLGFEEIKKFAPTPDHPFHMKITYVRETKLINSELTYIDLFKIMFNHIQPDTRLRPIYGEYKLLVHRGILLDPVNFDTNDVFKPVSSLYLRKALQTYESYLSSSVLSVERLPSFMDRMVAAMQEK